MPDRRPLPLVTPDGPPVCQPECEPFCDDPECHGVIGRPCLPTLLEATQREQGPIFASSTFSLGAVLAILQNAGIDTTCGACCEVAFTGVSLAQHSCPEQRRTCGRCEHWGDMHMFAHDGESAWCRGFGVEIRTGPDESCSRFEERTDG